MKRKVICLLLVLSLTGSALAGGSGLLRGIFPHIDGSLNGRYDHNARVWYLSGIEDGDIIAKQRGDYTNKNRYWKLGSYTIPEGFEDVTEEYTDASAYRTETYRKDWWFTKENDVNMKYICVTGVGSKADEMIETMKLLFTVIETETDEQGNVISETVAYEPVLEKGTYNGMDYQGFVSAVTENVSAETGAVIYQKLVAYYVEARCDKCVLVYVDSQSEDKDSFADDDTYRAFAFEAMDGITLIP